MLHNAKIAEITTPNGEVFEIVFASAFGDSWRENGIFDKEENCIIYIGNIQARQKLSIRIKPPEINHQKKDLAQKILLAILISHPSFLKDKEIIEKLKNIDFKDKELKDFSLVLYSMGMANAFLETEILKEIYHVYSNEDLFDKELILHAPFAMPGSDPQTALERWKEIWHHTVWKQQVKSDLHQAQCIAKQSFDHKNWEKLKVLKTTLLT